jgi:hypothetical protein
MMKFFNFDEPAVEIEAPPDLEKEAGIFNGPATELGRACLCIPGETDGMPPAGSLVCRLGSRAEEHDGECRVFFRYDQTERALFDEFVPKMPDGIRLALDGVFVFSSGKTLTYNWFNYESLPEEERHISAAEFEEIFGANKP